MEPICSDIIFGPVSIACPELPTYKPPVKIPITLTYQEARFALSKGKTILCKPERGSSFLASNWIQLKRRSGTVNLDSLKDYKYVLL